MGIQFYWRLINKRKCLILMCLEPKHKGPHSQNQIVLIMNQILFNLLQIKFDILSRRYASKSLQEHELKTFDHRNLKRICSECKSFGKRFLLKSSRERVNGLQQLTILNDYIPLTTQNSSFAPSSRMEVNEEDGGHINILLEEQSNLLEFPYYFT